MNSILKDNFFLDTFLIKFITKLPICIKNNVENNCYLCFINLSLQCLTLGVK